MERPDGYTHSATATGTPFLSVIIPAYREAERIGTMLSVVNEVLRRQPFSSEVLIVDDGSPDATADVVRTFARRAPHFHLLTHRVNQGKGAAIRTGMRAARGTYTLFADADNATPFDTELPKLLAKAEEGHDIVMASRYLPESNVAKKQSLFRRLMSRGGNLAFRLLLGLHFSDTRCGFKLFTERARTIIAERLTLERWGFDTEALVIAQHHHLSVAEVPVTWFDRERGQLHPIRDSLRSFTEILTIRNQRRAHLYD